MSSNDVPAVAALPDVARVREIVKSGDPLTWDLAWLANLTPWDNGEIQPPLREVVESGVIDFPRQGRALVPGCGSGYDALYIASALRLDTIGMDVSQTAITRAQAILASKEVPAPGKASFEQGDFFALKPLSDGERFDVIYDYTFFVAIPPTRRPEWGRQMVSLVKPGGYLITLVWPIDSPTDLGPPFFVRVEHYEQVLGDNFVKVFDEVPGTSMPNHVNKERIMVWKRS
ncbi:S-adenosyl-L-methionine-dependent methyltransferase [Lyophyllum atratum]|nr:S-adenosyl-L-methionine-dependent methyltransferase [Lyophyllum atratum]